MRQIKFYRTRAGKSPVEEFLDSLNSKHAEKVTWTFRLIEDMDQVPVQYFKKLKNTDDIWEVRARIGSHSFWIFDRLVGHLPKVGSHGEESLNDPNSVLYGSFVL